MPNPFRHYEGVPLVDLPADPAAPQISALEVLEAKREILWRGTAAEFLSQLMFYSASISGVQASPVHRSYLLSARNPSSGNLHPTEFHFCTRGWSIVRWPLSLPSLIPHAEQRASEFWHETYQQLCPLIFVLTSIAWREAWKYRDRAYRYCLHDIGHAWQALTLAARSLGSELCYGHFLDDRVAESCLFSADEWPMLIVGLHGPSIPGTSRMQTRWLCLAPAQPIVGGKKRTSIERFHTSLRRIHLPSWRAEGIRPR